MDVVSSAAEIVNHVAFLFFLEVLCCVFFLFIDIFIFSILSLNEQI